ncbi:hypothetical protein SCALM49S_10173 [Streptomyces californicus]
MSRLCWASSSALWCQFGVGRLECLLAVLQLLRAVAQLLGQLLRLLQQLLRLGVDADRVDAGGDHLGELVEEVPLDVRERLEGGQLDHAEDLALEEDRQHDHMRRRGLPEPDEIFRYPGGTLSTWIVRFSSAAVPMSVSPGRGGRHRAGGVAVTPPHPQLVRAVLAVVGTDLIRIARRHRQEERAVLSRDHRRQLAHDQRGHVVQIAAALHQSGDPGEVALQPVLLLVGERHVAQVRDHRVDVVLEDLDLPGRVDVILSVMSPRATAVVDRRDGAYLRGQVPGRPSFTESVRSRQVRRGPHARLAARAALRRRPRSRRASPVRERGQRLGHRLIVSASSGTSPRASP